MGFITQYESNSKLNELQANLVKKFIYLCLGRSEQAPIDNLKTLFLCTIGLYSYYKLLKYADKLASFTKEIEYKGLIDEVNSKEIANTATTVNSYLYDREGNLLIRIDRDSKQIEKDFNIFFINYRLNDKSSSFKAKDTILEHSFAPIINENSKKIADAFKAKLINGTNISATNNQNLQRVNELHKANIKFIKNIVKSKK